MALMARCRRAALVEASIAVVPVRVGAVEVAALLLAVPSPLVTVEQAQTKSAGPVAWWEPVDWRVPAVS